MSRYINLLVLAEAVLYVPPLECPLYYRELCLFLDLSLIPLATALLASLAQPSVICWPEVVVTLKWVGTGGASTGESTGNVGPAPNQTPERIACSPVGD
jgi:hypothetical protein